MTKILKKTMFDTFQIEGIWSISKSKKFENWNHGILYISPEEKRLEIFNTLDDCGDIFPVTGGTYNIVYGFSMTGESITLSTVIRTGEELRMPGIPTETYQISNFLISSEKFNPEVIEYQLKYFKCALTFSNVWLENTMVERKLELHKQTITLNAAKRTLISTVQHEGREFIVSADERGRVANANFNINLETETRFDIRPTEGSLSASEAISIVSELAKFCTILFGKVVSVKYVQGRINDKDNFNMFFEQNYPINLNETIQKQRFRPQYNEIKSSFARGLTQWFNMSEEMQLLINDYLLTVTQKSVLENDLINLTQGVESYYRKEKLSLLDKMQKLMSVIPQSILNRERLEKRIDNEALFTKKLKNTRVYLTHGTNKNGRYSGDNLIRGTEVFQLAVRYFILVNLGFSDSDLEYLASEFNSVLDLKISTINKVFF